MSAIGVSTFVPYGAPVPADLVLRLAETNLASLAVACFLFNVVLVEAKLYWRRAWANDSKIWRASVVIMTVGCGIDLGLFAAAVGVGMRDLGDRTYSRDTMDAIYIGTKVFVWCIGIICELFFALRVYNVLPRYGFIAWVLFGITALPFLCAFIFFLLYRFYDYRFGQPARICDLIGGWANAVFAVVTVIVLGWRIVLQRRNDKRQKNDALTALFRGALATSALIALTSGGGAVFSCLLNNPRAYMLASFFWNIYPFTAAISTIFALQQRQVLRQRVGSADSVPALPGREVKAATLKLGQRSEHPSDWRGDRVSLGPGVCDIKPSKADSLLPRRDSQRGGETSFHDVALDTKALERCEPTRSQGVWVHREAVVIVEERVDPLDHRREEDEEFCV
ncbi:hypothetical protein JCM6882_009514 [Rhodosporidiobolus microsporus]